MCNYVKLEIGFKWEYFCVIVIVQEYVIINKQEPVLEGIEEDIFHMEYPTECIESILLLGHMMFDPSGDANMAARTERIMFMRDGKVVSEMQLKFTGTDIDDTIIKVRAKMLEIGI